MTLYVQEKEKMAKLNFLVKSRNLGKAICTKYFLPDLLNKGEALAIMDVFVKSTSNRILQKNRIRI